MKKITLLFAAMVLSGSASAALEFEGPGGQLTLLDCPGTTASPLSEDVTISLSTNVQAGFACNDTVIVMAACHAVGRQTGRTVTGPIPEGCNPNFATDGQGTACTGTGSFQVTGPAFPTASTAGGTVTAMFPVADVTGGCTTANARAHAGEQLPE